MRIRWLQSALDNIEQLRAYIAERDPGSASVVVDRILSAVESLSAFPMRGRAGRSVGTRELVVARTPYIVAYRVNGDGVEILRVLHGAQKWPDL